MSLFENVRDEAGSGAFPFASCHADGYVAILGEENLSGGGIRKGDVLLGKSGCFDREFGRLLQVEVMGVLCLICDENG